MNTGELALAERQLEQALALRPTLSAAHRLMGQIHLAGSTEVKARDSLIHALRLDPGDTAAYALLVPLLNALDDQEAAEKYLELGRRSARQPGSLQNP
jgi:Tfp pilus assembly protein PilF